MAQCMKTKYPKMFCTICNTKIPNTKAVQERVTKRGGACDTCHTMGLDTPERWPVPELGWSAPDGSKYDDYGTGDPDYKDAIALDVRRYF